MSKSSTQPAKMLVNKLSVDDARHLVRNEGGEMSGLAFGWNLLSVFVISGLCARAIWLGHASARHLVLPMVAQYLVLLVFLPVLYVVMRASDLRKEAMRSLAWLGTLIVAVSGYVLYESRRSARGWQEVLDSGAQDIAGFLVDSHMIWPLMGVAVNSAVDLPRRVNNLKKFGPPFVGVSLGCAARFLVFLLGVMLIPFVVQNPQRIAWIVWALILFAELVAIWMRWDIQRRLKKLDSAVGDARSGH
jgi:hypothetical protein